MVGRDVDGRGCVSRATPRADAWCSRSGRATSAGRPSGSRRRTCLRSSRCSAAAHRPIGQRRARPTQDECVLAPAACDDQPVIWVLFIVVAVLLVGVFAAMVAGRVSYDPMAAPVTTQPDTGLAEGFVARDDRHRPPRHRPPGLSHGPGRRGAGPAAGPARRAGARARGPAGHQWSAGRGHARAAGRAGSRAAGRAGKPSRRPRSPSSWRPSSPPSRVPGSPAADDGSLPPCPHLPRQPCSGLGRRSPTSPATARGCRSPRCASTRAPRGSAGASPA